MKRFSRRVFAFSIPLLIPVFIYLFLTITREISGDIGKMSKIFFEKGYHDKLAIVPDSLFVKNVEIEDIPDSAAILCFGDSFSAQRPYPYLQPVGEYFNETVLNVLYNLDYAPEEAALAFLASAPQSKMPRIMIVESVERSCCPRLFWLDTTNCHFLDQLQKGKKHSSSTSKKSFEKEFISFCQYRLGWDDGTISAKTNKLCFTSKGNEDELFSYYEDTIHYPDEFIVAAAEKLQQLHQFAKNRNVELVYVVATNKSTLYAPYTNNENLYFTIENRVAFDTLPFCFNPTNIIRQLDQSGEKDIYYCDDTHWTPKTAKIVGEKLTEKIIKTNRIAQKNVRNAE